MFSHYFLSTLHTAHLGGPPIEDSIKKKKKPDRNLRERAYASTRETWGIPTGGNILLGRTGQDLDTQYGNPTSDKLVFADVI